MPSATNTGRIVPFRPMVVSETELARLFRAHEHRLINYLHIRLGSRAEAEDVAQTTYLRLHLRHGMLHETNLVALIYVTARNVATDLLRQRSRIASAVDGGITHAVENVGDDEADAERTLLARQEIALILKVIEDLPDKCRQSFIAHRIDGTDYHEIAIRLGVTTSMVRKYVLKATAYCARRFEELEGWE